MIRLGIDLCLPEGSVAVAEGSQILSAVVWNRPKIHSEVVFSQIENALKLSGKSLEEIGEVVVSSGPGSFTGVRLSVSVGKAFKVFGINVLSATTLRALSYGYESLGFTPVPVIPARKNKFYAEVNGSYLDATLDELVQEIKTLENPLVVFKGDLPQELKSFPHVQETSPLAVKLLKLEKENLSPLTFYYLRKPDAKPQVKADR
jgi:tRNA threonylcarbamoyladenosine biosynthesis protein TsaB